MQTKHSSNAHVLIFLLNREQLISDSSDILCMLSLHHLIKKVTNRGASPPMAGSLAGACGTPCGPCGVVEVIMVDLEVYL